jgi:Mlc titration factor MtfA (ptsG expression regulator)
MLQRLLDWHRARRARRLVIADFQWCQAEARLPFLSGLGPAESERLRQMARQFIADKQWSAARGLVLTTDIQLGIALQACLPILNLGLDWYRGWVGIVVYPGDFVIPRQFVDDDGIVHEYDDEVLGEAWEGGPVLLGWFDAAEQPQGESGAINIVIHEFAHKLDMRRGYADGTPPLHRDMSRERWQRTMEEAFEDLNLRLDRDEETPIDPYAAEAPAEFFAVCSEAFFTQPANLSEAYPEVYRELSCFYRQNPLSRLAASEPAADRPD